MSLGPEDSLRHEAEDTNLKKSWVIHPFAIAAFPTMVLYSYNAQVLSLSMTWVPLVVALAFTAIFLLTAWLICGNFTKAGFIVSIFLALLYSTGHLFTLTTWLGIGNPYLGGLLLFLIWFPLFPYVVYLILGTRKTLRSPTIILNVATVVMVAISLLRIGSSEFGRLSGNQQCEASGTTVALGTPGGQALPDIYYIILDRYACASTLAETYDLDNSYFIDYLTSKGFYVASESSANYVRTSESLASSLNMEYIDYMDEESSDLLPMNVKIEDNALQRSLKAAGYKFVHVGSWWGPTRESQYADININYCASHSEFLESVLSTTMPYSVSAELGAVDDMYIRQWKRTLYEFERLAEIPNMFDEPTFTFAHFLISHPQYTFRSDGSYLPPEEASRMTNKDLYVNGLVASNDLFSELINQLLSASEVPPIIILQGDEGPYPDRYRANYRAFDWREATDMELREKMGILNAYYLPGVHSSVLYPAITPVNSFRVVLDLYFGTDLGLLPDKSYVYVNYSHPFQFLDVTDKLRR
jgi:hypothetical protein